VSRTARIALGFLGLLVMGVLLLPPFLPDPLQIDPGDVAAGPSPSHWLGTDELGRDLLARLLVGARTTLAIATLAALISSGGGALLGLWAGYQGGHFDRAVLRLLDLVSAVPRLPLMLLLASTSTGSPFLRVAVAMAAFAWISEARIARAQTRVVLSEDYLSAARQLGYSPLRIAMRHVLPNLSGPLSVAATLSLGELILYETVLSFLGLGIPPPAPSWGAMLAQGISGLSRAPLLVVAPGALIFLTIAAIQRVGDELALALDPRTRNR
jgi:peptide/nickel transport system permease protein